MGSTGAGRLNAIERRRAAVSSGSAALPQAVKLELPPHYARASAPQSAPETTLAIFLTIKF